MLTKLQSCSFAVAAAAAAAAAAASPPPPPRPCPLPTCYRYTPAAAHATAATTTTTTTTMTSHFLSSCGLAVEEVVLWFPENWLDKMCGLLGPMHPRRASCLSQLPSFDHFAPPPPQVTNKHMFFHTSIFALFLYSLTLVVRGSTLRGLFFGPLQTCDHGLIGFLISL